MCYSVESCIEQNNIRLKPITTIAFVYVYQGRRGQGCPWVATLHHAHRLHCLCTHFRLRIFCECIRPLPLVLRVWSKTWQGNCFRWRLANWFNLPGIIHRVVGLKWVKSVVIASRQIKTIVKNKEVNSTQMHVALSVFWDNLFLRGKGGVFDVNIYWLHKHHCPSSSGRG